MLRRQRLTRRRLLLWLSVALGILLLAMMAALTMGPEIISPSRIVEALTSDGHDVALDTILFQLRLPRLILSISVGAALACAGVIFQALLRNPLAEPYILGVSNGSAVGVILGYLFGVGSLFLPLLAFAGGGAVVMAVFAISRGTYGRSSESMLLGGVMVGAISAALIFLLLHFLGPQVRLAIQWMLGDLSSTSSSVGYGSLALFAAVLGGSLFVGDTLNALALGEEEAASLGVRVARVQMIAYLTGSFIVGVTVAFCGAIGFVGLVVPHIIRRMFGPDHRALLPLSAVGGGLFLLICDTVARSLMPAMGQIASELPVGAITALVGAPLFIYLLRRGGGGQG